MKSQRSHDNRRFWEPQHPHPVCNWPNAGKKIEEQFAGVAEEEVRQITWGNGARIYGIA